MGWAVDKALTGSIQQLFSKARSHLIELYVAKGWPLLEALHGTHHCTAHWLGEVQTQVMGTMTAPVALVVRCVQHAATLHIDATSASLPAEPLLGGPPPCWPM
jgi:hypothetical protein